MDFGWIIARVQNILMRPKDEWYVVDGEEGSVQQVFTYAAVVAAIPALLGLLIGLIYIGPFAIVNAVIGYAFTFGFLYVAALIVDFLAPNFDTEKHFPSALKLVTYSATPGWVAVALSYVLGLIPALGAILALLLLIAAIVYYVYLFYYGILILMRAPVNKAIGYTAASIGIMFAAAFVFGMILAALRLAI
ncbi:MAG: YIP1 family protein [Xanthobacteraceae bacterium]|nr:YIP1 family protein [Xanthobacteraceae bacterium]QYK45240.1 MAG: YIP1 family protein [Xanthobacteraceae bacterium]HMN50479.1 YIP1 family protein [Xanthobacteraceae bacterium]